MAEVASRLGFPYLSPAAARVCRNKPETRKALRAAGLATPEFRLVRSEDEARQAAAEITYPCVVKPPADSSSKGVKQVSDAQELLEHFRKIHAWRENDRGQHLRGEVLIESLIEGAEFSVETVTLAPGRTRVVGITAKHLSPPLFLWRSDTTSRRCSRRTPRCRSSGRSWRPWRPWDSTAGLLILRFA